jgi:hypothetical protein
MVKEVTAFDPPRAPRAATSLVARVTAGRRQPERFTILNVSVTGAKLEGPLSLALKDKIKIRFDWEGKSIELAAEVVRVDSPDLMSDQIAARFVDVSDDAKQVLAELVAGMLEIDEDGDEHTEEAVIVVEDETE